MKKLNRIRMHVICLLRTIYSGKNSDAAFFIHGILRELGGKL